MVMIYKFKATYNIRWYNFCLGSISKNFQKDKQISLNGIAYDFLVEHSPKLYLIFTRI